MILDKRRKVSAGFPGGAIIGLLLIGLVGIASCTMKDHQAKELLKETKQTELGAQKVEMKNTIGMEFVRITVDALNFSMSIYSVTNAQYKQFLDSQPGWPEPLKRPIWGVNPDPKQIMEQSIVGVNSDFRQKYGWSNRTDYPHERGDYPVVGIYYRDAKRFCKWLSKKEGKNYYLHLGG